MIDLLLVSLIIALSFAVKLKDPMRSSEARGKVGGVIHSTARGAKYAKVFTAPSQPRTARQLKIRRLMQNMTRSWQTLLAAKRAAWNTWANDHPVVDSLGDSVRLSGFNCYCGLNTRLADLGYPVSDTPPTIAAPNGLAAFAAADGVLSSVLTWTPTSGTNMTAVIYLYGPHSPGRQPKLVRAKMHEAGPAELGTISLPNLTPGYHTMFAAVVNETDGQISTWVYDSCTITAA